MPSITPSPHHQWQATHPSHLAEVEEEKEHPSHLAEVEEEQDHADGHDTDSDVVVEHELQPEVALESVGCVHTSCQLAWDCIPGQSQHNMSLGALRFDEMRSHLKECLWGFLVGLG